MKNRSSQNSFKSYIYWIGIDSIQISQYDVIMMFNLSQFLPIDNPIGSITRSVDTTSNDWSESPTRNRQPDSCRRRERIKFPSCVKLKRRNTPVPLEERSGDVSWHGVYNAGSLISNYAFNRGKNGLWQAIGLRELVP